MKERKLDLRELLSYIDPTTCTYEEWLNVGLALHQEGYDCQCWDEWSRRDAERYHAGECDSKWRSFGSYTARRVTGATITQMAKEAGWVSQRSLGPGVALDFTSSVIAYPAEEYKVVDVNYLDDTEIQLPKDYTEERGIKELITYLEVLFDHDEFVGYVTNVFVDDEGNKIPTKGKCMRTAKQLIDTLQRTQSIADALGSVDEEMGAWIRFNPLDGKGVKNDNVAAYRYTLIESDGMPTGQQKAILEQLELPIAAMVYSGGKSIHAIVKVDADSYDEYRKRVDFIYQIVQKNGFSIDKHNRNPSRLSRMPGVMRNGKPQFLIGTNLGKENYKEWAEWIETVNDDLPEPEGLASVWDHLPELAPPLIDGILREGHKILLAGPSKAGKSFSLIQLCIAIAEGRKWLGFQCTQGRVLYVNLELDRASCLHRFRDVYENLGQEPRNLNNIAIWNLRGKSLPMDALAPKLIRRAQKQGYKAVVIDPIYKIITGDENSADQMARFCNQFDKVAAELNCAVIYCHHHSKGSQGQKRSMDRASGSGVFARDPDALLDLIQLDVKDEVMENQESNVTAWRLEGTLREYPSFKPVNLWFKYPIHEIDATGMLAMASFDTPQEKGAYTVNKRKKAIKESRKDKLLEAFNNLSAFTGGAPVEISDVANYLDISERTIRRYLEETPIFKIENGKMVHVGTVD